MYTYLHTSIRLLYPVIKRILENVSSDFVIQIGPAVRKNAGFSLVEIVNLILAFTQLGSRILENPRSGEPEGDGDQSDSVRSRAHVNAM